jgi:peptide-methionine (R)-S-oxide reductase
MADQKTNPPTSDEAWREKLGDEAFIVMRRGGTERPFSGQYNLFFEKGTYRCRGCGTALFTSDAKFNSHCGWPSFDRAIEAKTILEVPDYSHNMIRTEILCASCDSHLGHVFPDGPTETGTRYCVNSVCLDFVKDERN